MKVLILYSSYGGGHVKAAEALKEYNENEHPDYDLEFIDAVKYTSPELNTMFLKSYVQLSKNLPKAWGKLYNLADRHASITELSTLVNKAVSKKFLNMLTDFDPDIILCTHSFSVDMLANLKRKNMIKAKLGMVITDYFGHAIWVTQPDVVDAFFVAQDIMVNQLESYDISKEKVYVTGIPSMKAFNIEHNKEEIRKEFNLDPSIFTILFFPGGEYGLAKNTEIFKEMLRLDNVQIITVAGKNEKLKANLEKMAKCSSKNVVILGYTNKIPEILSISDIVVSKPGGLTTTEAIVTQTPIVITSPLPGQEEHNSNYVLNNGLGYRLFDNTDKLLTLKSIIDNKERLEQVKHMQKLLAKPNAAKDICETMINLANEK